jgi:hypothetical protein
MDHDFISRYPHPGTDPVARLRHVLDVYGEDVTDDRMAVQATGSAYQPGEQTGLTFGDLRAIAKLIGA